MTAPVRLLDRYTPWFEGAVRTHTFGEDALWEISFGIAPVDNKAAPVAIFYLEMKGVLLGNRLADISFLPLMEAMGVTPEIADQTVKEAVARLMEQKNRQRAMGNGGGQLIDPTKPLQQGRLA